MIGIDRTFNKLNKVSFVKSLFAPDSFNVVIWVRIYQWLERHHLPTFFAYRYLYHIHGLEMARRVKIGEGLRIPHPHGVLFTKRMEIGKRVSIYGNVRFTRSWDDVPKIGNDLLIGDSVVFIGKGEVGNNVIIGAGSVVTKRFPDHVVIAGNPAKIIKENRNFQETSSGVESGVGPS